VFKYHSFVEKVLMPSHLHTRKQYLPLILISLEQPAGGLQLLVPAGKGTLAEVCFVYQISSCLLQINQH